MTRSTDSDTERSAENVFNRIWAVEGTRIMLAVLGFLIMMAWNGIKDDVAEVKKNQDSSGVTQSSMQSDIRNINTRLDEGVIKQVSETKEKVQKLEERVDRLESKVRIP